MLYKIGSSGDTAYILISGKVSVYKDDVLSSKLDARRTHPFLVSSSKGGDLVGEFEALENIPRVFCARSLEPCHLLVIDGVVLRSFMERHGRIFAKYRTLRDQRFFRKLSPREAGQGDAEEKEKEAGLD